MKITELLKLMNNEFKDYETLDFGISRVFNNRGKSVIVEKSDKKGLFNKSVFMKKLMDILVTDGDIPVYVNRKAISSVKLNESGSISIS